MTALFYFFPQVHHEYLNSQASESIELQRLCICFIFYNCHAKQKGDIKQAHMTPSPPGEFVCPAGINKQNMNIQDKAASDLPYAICTGDNAALPSHAQQKGVLIPG